MITLGLDENDQSIYIKREIKKYNLKIKESLERYKKTMEFPYEQRDLTSRLIGIWLWDGVHLIPNPMKPSEAIKEILFRFKNKLPPSFTVVMDDDGGNQRIVKRMLGKEYNLACRCIEKCELLHLSKSKSKE